MENIKLGNVTMADLGKFGELALAYAGNFVVALIILLIGLWIGRWIKTRLMRMGDRYDALDPTLMVFLGNLARYVILVLTIVVVLSQFGVKTTSLIALLGAAGLAVGLALQGTLSNVAAGVMILLLRPFKIGDYVEGAGEAGTVKLISLFNTELATPDNIQVFIPNSELWGSAIRNFSFHPTRRIDIDVGIAYEDDIDKAFKAIAALAKDTRVFKEPEPQTMVSSLGDSAVNVRLRVWCANADYWPLKWDLTKQSKQAMDKAGITIAYPTRTIYQAKA